MRVGVLALQGDVANHRRLLAGLGVDVAAVRSVDDLALVDGLVIPGGESSVMDKLARRVGLFDPLAQRLREGMPALGTCAGMIMLADQVEGAIEGQQSFGGLDATVRRNAFGRQVDSFEADLTITGVTDLGVPEPEPERSFRAVFIRAPWVERVGPQVEVLAEHAGHPVALRQGPLLATAFHPELTGDDRVHRLFLQSLRTS